MRFPYHLALFCCRTVSDLQANSIIGQAKELVGSGIEAAYSAVGGSSEPSSFTTAGKEQHAKGEAEIKAAQAQGYVEG